MKSKGINFLSIRFTRVCLFLTLFFLCVSCVPIPQVHRPPDVASVRYHVKPERVKTEYVELAGFDESTTPDKYDKALYARYFLMSQNAETIIVLMPGIYGGATSLELLARQLVAALPNVEVWAVDRRSNLLEDRSVMMEALNQKNPRLAYDYYVKNFGEENGFNIVPPDDVRFMAQWGLDVHLRDLHEIIKRAEKIAPRVILGGHSLGGSLIDYYAAYLFEDGAGHEHLDGLVQIDGVLGRTGGFNRPPEGLSLAGLQLVPGLKEIERGDANPYFPLMATPQNFARREVMALLAQADPEGLSPLSEIPVSNMARLGLADDDEFTMSTAFGSSMGKSVGATYGGNITPVILAGSEGFYSRSVTGVAAGFDRVTWTPGNPNDEHVNPDDLAGVWSTAYSNRSEWYFPLRLTLEIGQYDVRLEDTPGFVPSSQVKLPTLAVGAGRGLVTNLEGFAAYNDCRVGSAFSMYILPDFTHLDIVYAQENPLVGIMAVWLGSLPRTIK
jgi:pimeloyl-ACP methyl ester carboxylesterase